MRGSKVPRSRVDTHAPAGRIAYRLAQRMLAVALLACLAVPAPARAQDDPASIVRDATHRILTLIDANLQTYRKDPQAFHEVVDGTLARHFDFEGMARLMLGKERWQAAKESTRKEFIAQFRILLIRTYGSTLLNYRGQAVSLPEVLDRFDANGAPITDPKAPDTEVRIMQLRTRIESSQASQGHYLVDYTFLRTPQRWAVIDLLIDGVGLVNTYKANFKPTLETGRGIEGVNEGLRNLNESASKNAGS